MGTLSIVSAHLPLLRSPRAAKTVVDAALPLELAFWALWHCRHARPPDSAA